MRAVEKVEPKRSAVVAVMIEEMEVDEYGDLTIVAGGGNIIQAIARPAIRVTAPVDEFEDAVSAAFVELTTRAQSALRADAAYRSQAGDS